MQPKNQRTEKEIRTFKMLESFDQTFSKVCGVEWAEPPSSRSAEREISYRCFLFGKLAQRFVASLRASSYFLCAYTVKEKAAKAFVRFNITPFS